MVFWRRQFWQFQRREFLLHLQILAAFQRLKSSDKGILRKYSRNPARFRDRSFLHLQSTPPLRCRIAPCMHTWHTYRSRRNRQIQIREFFKTRAESADTCKYIETLYQLYFSPFPILVFFVCVLHCSFLSPTFIWLCKKPPALLYRRHMKESFQWMKTPQTVSFDTAYGDFVLYSVIYVFLSNI